MHWRGRILVRVVSWATTLWLAPQSSLAQQTSSTSTGASGSGWQGLRVVIDSLYVEDGALLVDFHADSLVTAKLLEGLRRGLTSSISYHLQLWHKRWISDLIAERRFEWKAAFDNWEQKYIVVGGGERRLTAAAATLRAKWTTHRSLQLVDIDRLQPGRNYYLVVEAFFEPVSKENLREIRGWLAGEVKGGAPADSNTAHSGVKLRLLETLMNLIGFGGKKISTRSATFQLRENAILWQP